MPARVVVAVATTSPGLFFFLFPRGHTHKKNKTKCTQHFLPNNFFFFFPADNHHPAAMAEQPSSSIPVELTSPSTCCKCGMRTAGFLWTCNNCGRKFCAIWGANHALDPVAHPCIRTVTEGLRFTNAGAPTDPENTYTLEELRRTSEAYRMPASDDEALCIAKRHAPYGTFPMPSIAARMASLRPAIATRMLCPLEWFMCFGTEPVKAGGDHTLSTLLQLTSEPTVVLLSANGDGRHARATLRGDPTMTGFPYWIIDHNGHHDTGTLHWVVVYPSRIPPQCERAFAAGRATITSHGVQTVKFPVPFARPPVVLLTGDGASRHASANLRCAPTTMSFGCMLIDHNGHYDTGTLHWIAIDPEALPDVYAQRIVAGRCAVTAPGNHTESFPSAVSRDPPVTILTGDGADGHGYATLLPPHTATKFTHRLIDHNGHYCTGMVHWAAFV